jgi:plasmid stabilization system protein ParE
MIYKIFFSPEADEDMLELENHIRYTLKSPLTAAKYMKELDVTIQRLASFPNIFSRNEYVQKRFGSNALHVLFKKMAIVYIIENDIVYILRVIPGSLIY